MPQINQQPWWAQSRPYPSQQYLNNAPNQQMQPGSSGRPTFLYGKVVNSEDDIRVSDVPMDGSVGLFPTSDWSCIITKAWSNDGQIRVMRYVAEELREPPKPEPVPVPAPQPQPQQPVQPQLTVEQVGQMIDTKIGQLITALMGNQQQQAQQTPQPAKQPSKQQNKPNKEEAP